MSNIARRKTPQLEFLESFSQKYLASSYTPCHVSCAEQVEHEVTAPTGAKTETKNTKNCFEVQNNDRCIPDLTFPDIFLETLRKL